MRSERDWKAIPVPFSLRIGLMLGPRPMTFAGLGPTLSCLKLGPGSCGLPTKFSLTTNTCGTPLGFGKPVSGAVDWNTIMPPVLLNDGWVLSPSDELVIWRSSLVSRLYMKICRCEAAALPVHAALFGSQPKIPSASKPTHTSSWFPASTAANVAVAIVGLSGSPGPLVIWRRYGVPIGGHGVFWQLVGVSLSAHRFVVSCAQS